MKKSLILASLLVVGLSACDKRDDTPADPPAIDPVPPMSTPAPSVPMDPPASPTMTPPDTSVPPASPTAPAQTN